MACKAEIVGEFRTKGAGIHPIRLKCPFTLVYDSLFLPDGQEVAANCPIKGEVTITGVPWSQHAKCSNYSPKHCTFANLKERLSNP